MSDSYSYGSNDGSYEGDDDYDGSENEYSNNKGSCMSDNESKTGEEQFNEGEFEFNDNKFENAIDFYQQCLAKEKKMGIYRKTAGAYGKLIKCNTKLEKHDFIIDTLIPQFLEEINEYDYFKQKNIINSIKDNLEDIEDETKRQYAVMKFNSLLNSDASQGGVGSNMIEYDITVKNLIIYLQVVSYTKFKEQLKVLFQEIQLKSNILGKKIFVGCGDGSLLEFSINEKKTVPYKNKFSARQISSMVKTSDNKSQFVCSIQNLEPHNLFKFDIPTSKQVKIFSFPSARHCVVTHDNKFLITATDEDNNVLTKWSIRSNKQLHAWDSGVNQYVSSQSCSQDNKYQLIGYNGGWLGIFDLKKQRTLKKIQAMANNIYSMAFSRDNQSVFISDEGGGIKMISWKIGASSEDYFDFSKHYVMVGKGFTGSICLTKDEKYLLVGSKALVSVLEIATRTVIKEFELLDSVESIILIKDGKTALIAERNGNLSTISLETLEISLQYSNITKNKYLNKIILI